MPGGAKYERDEAKRIRTLEQRGIDFRAAIAVFDAEPLVIESPRADEKRWIAIGLLHGVEVAVIYTLRGDIIRIITARRARHNERRAYHARYN